MTDRHVRVATAALALAGIAIASYLSYSRATDTALICPTSGCGTVQRSAYSELVGIPVAYLGVAGYVLILMSTLSASVRAAAAGTLLALSGFAFAAYLLVAQIFLIDAVCVWCISSDAVLFAITLLALGRLRWVRTRRP
jgi:uncharacterized membrane protein